MGDVIATAKWSIDEHEYKPQRPAFLKHFLLSINLSNTSKIEYISLSQGIKVDFLVFRRGKKQIYNNIMDFALNTKIRFLLLRNTKSFYVNT